MADSLQMTPSKWTKPPSISDLAEGADPVTTYAEWVCSGELVAGPHVRAACRRHLKDLQDGPARGLRWDLDAALRVIHYFRDILRLNGGEFEGVPYILLLWQAFIVGSLFGWKGPDGYRRFRQAFIETGKGSGKSPLAAGIGLYGLTSDKEHRAEIYAAATKKDQAMVLFRDAVAMVTLTPELAGRLILSGVGERTWNIAYPQLGGFFKPISADDGQSGPRPHMSLLDEVHEHKSNYVIEMLRAGWKGRRQPLQIEITNSGVDQQSVAHERHTYGVKVVNGVLDDDESFFYICALDKGEDPFKDRSCWPKANPSLGVTIQENYLAGQVKQALGMPSKQSIVKRLNFCIWVEGANALFDGDSWNACNQGGVQLSALAGRKCYGGLDLSSTKDLTSFALAFEPTEDDPLWRLMVWNWLPEVGLAAREESDKVPYTAWRDAGHIETTPGKAVSKSFVAQRIGQIIEGLELVSIAYDRWRIQDFKSTLDTEGLSLPLVEFGQGFKDMAPAIDAFEDLVTSEKLDHGGHPVLTWCAANAEISKDAANNRKIDKAKSTGRVDALVASVMAVGIAPREVEDKTPPADYELTVI